jgi:FkbM family methyltransferase
LVELIKQMIHRGLRLFGADVHRYAHTLPAVRRRTLNELGIDLVLDVGANQGQYARELRRSGYSGRIVSFEPLPEAFDHLAEAFSSDPLWEGHQLALGETDGRTQINVSGNSVSSSVLEMSSEMVAAVPAAAYAGSREVTLCRLDTIVERILGLQKNVYLKMDVQGYERAVLTGARRTLDRVAAIESELSLLPLYRGQALFHEVTAYLIDAGFEPIWLEKGLIDPRSGHLLELDAVFIRRSAST